MMARSHASAGAVLSLAAAPLLVQTGVVDGRPVSYVVLALTAIGSALLPDYDHAHATIAQSLGPVTKGVAHVVSAAFGGHRNGTHSFVGIAFFTAVSWLMVHLGGWWVGLWCGFLVATGLAALGFRVSKTSIIVHTVTVIAATAWLLHIATTGSVPLELVTWGVAIGSLAHILTDLPTKQGCPLLWPVNRTRFKVGNMTTDHFTERVIVGPALMLIAVAQVVWLDGLWPTMRDAVTTSYRVIAG